MSVADKDVSNYDGEPIILYDFFRKSVPTLTGVPVETHWRYTSADRDFVYAGDTYKAVAIADDGVRQSGSSTADQLTISMPYTETLPQLFVGPPPSDPIYCHILHGNEGETDAYLVWAGLIGMVARSAASGTLGSVTAQVVCNTVGATMDRTGLRLAWSRNCPHDLYGFECKADPRNFYVSAIIAGLSGESVTAVEIGEVFAPQLAGGFIEWIDSYGHAERLGVTLHVGQTIFTLGSTARLVVGQTIYAFFGCDRTRATCQLIFNNEDNHGGHAYMPDANPFNGDLVF